MSMINRNFEMSPRSMEFELCSQYVVVSDRPKFMYWKSYDLFRRSPGTVLCLLCSGCSENCQNESVNKKGHRWSQGHLSKKSKRTDFCWAR